MVQLQVESIPSLLREFADDFYIDGSAARAAFAAPYQFNVIDRRSAFENRFLALALRAAI